MMRFMEEEGPCRIIEMVQPPLLIGNEEPMGTLGYNWKVLETLMYCWERLAPYGTRCWWAKPLGQVMWAHGNTPSYMQWEMCSHGLHSVDVGTDCPPMEAHVVGLTSCSVLIAGAKVGCVMYLYPPSTPKMHKRAQSHLHL